MVISPVTSTTITIAVSGTAASFSTVMASDSGRRYEFISTTNCWIAQGATPTAAANANGSKYVPAGLPVIIDANVGATLSVVQDSAAGHACLTGMRLY